MDINRGAIVVKANQAYVDWANSCDDDPTKTSLDDVRRDSNIYLVPCWEDDDEFERVLRRVFRKIFDHELAGWTSDESVWPNRRSYKTFRQWFEIEGHSMVLEFGDGFIGIERP
jgi:hypothetical protein